MLIQTAPCQSTHLINNARQQRPHHKEKNHLPSISYYPWRQDSSPFLLPDRKAKHHCQTHIRLTRSSEVFSCYVARMLSLWAKQTKPTIYCQISQRESEPQNTKFHMNLSGFCKKKKKVSLTTSKWEIRFPSGYFMLLVIDIQLFLVVQKNKILC